MFLSKLEKIVKETYPDKSLTIRPSIERNLGDYSLAVQSLSDLEKNNLSEKISNLDPVKNVTTGSGFINIFLKEDDLLLALKNSDNKFLNLSDKIVLEFGNPNTHKSPHIGHLFSYFYGGALANILRYTGSEVVSVNYQGDIGLHVAKCLYFALGSWEKYLHESLGEKVLFLQDCYQKGSAVYEDDEKAKKDIDEINRDLYQGKNENLQKCWEHTRSWSLENYRHLESSWGINYDKHFYESSMAERAVKMVNSHFPDVFTQDNGALIFSKDKSGLHTRVFLNKYGLPTYEAKDLALAKEKLELYPQVQYFLTLTASEQNEYFKVVNKAICMVLKVENDRFQHKGFGMIRLEGGKISSRFGAPSAIDLIAEVRSAVAHSSKNSLTDEQINTIALSAIKWSFLNHDYRQNSVFDTKKATTLIGNTGPYLLYTSVRCGSIMKKSIGINADVGSFNDLPPTERTLLFNLSRFDEVVLQSAIKFSPHLLTTYLYELAKSFNYFYETEKIIDAPDNLRALRLSICHSIKRVVDKSLSLLGINVVEVM